MSDSKKRKKSYYCQAKRQCGGRQVLDVGVKGFLITCNRMEKQAIREAYNLLNEYSCELYGEESLVKSVNEGDASIEVDFGEAILSQVEALRGGGRVAAERRFQAVETKTSNCVFIRTTLDRPDELVAKLLNDVLDTGRTKSRFVLKMFPVLGTCRAVEDKIEKLVEELVSSRFADRPLGTFAIIYKVRCNSLSRDVILPTVGRAVYRACPTSKVDLANPDYVISVDVLNRIACVSVMKDFNRLKKYNLQELAKSEPCASSQTSEQPEVPPTEPVKNETDSAQEVGDSQQTEICTSTCGMSGSGSTSEKLLETGVDDSQATAETTGDDATRSVNIAASS